MMAGALKEIFEKILTDDVSRVAFKLKNGLSIEGYPIEIKDGFMVFGEGGPLASEELVQISLSDISLDPFSVYDNKRKKWHDLYWDENMASWLHKTS